MTFDEWRAAVAADAPPLSAEQIAILRPIWRLAAHHVNDASHAPAEAAAGDAGRSRPPAPRRQG
jgi:hypothetical protein